MPRHRRRRGIPTSKRIKNNPHAIKGHKVGAFQGGVIVSKQNPDGSVSRYAVDEHGRRTLLEQEAPHMATTADPSGAETQQHD